MADIQFPPISSDDALEYVNVKLRSRTVLDENGENPTTEYYGDVVTRWAGQYAVTKTVELSRLSPADRTAGLQFYEAIHALAVGDVVPKDFIE